MYKLKFQPSQTQQSEIQRKAILGFLWFIAAVAFMVAFIAMAYGVTDIHVERPAWLCISATCFFIICSMIAFSYMLRLGGVYIDSTVLYEVTDQAEQSASSKQPDAPSVSTSS